MPSGTLAASNAPREFLVPRVYTPLNEDTYTRRAQHFVHALYAYFVADPDRLSAEHQPRSTDDIPRRLADFDASMTDRYAIEFYEVLFVPRFWSV
jgi:dGTPase